MVTFYQFVRDALLALQGQTVVKPLPTMKVVCTSAIRKAPGRTEFQRGILSRGADGQWTVRTTGDQGSGILSSMSQAHCFIILPTETGNLEAGARHCPHRRPDAQSGWTDGRGYEVDADDEA